jgi:hypothetical protein
MNAQIVRINANIVRVNAKIVRINANIVRINAKNLIGKCFGCACQRKMRIFIVHCVDIPVG